MAPPISMERRVQQQIRTVERLLLEYQQERGIPLARFLAGFYKRNRQMGAKDRRIASRLAYHYFRIGHAVPRAEIPVRLAIAEFLCSQESEVARLMLPDLYPAIDREIDEKIELIEATTPFRLEAVFPFLDHLSEGIDPTAYATSMLVQPDLFIRLRPAYAAGVIAAFQQERIGYRWVGEHALALPNGTALEHVKGISGKYEVQDYSSQQTGKYFDASDGESWWDACTGAGGKALLLLDQHPGIRLLVSDVRSSILRNLNERFDAAGVKSYRQKIMDLTKDTIPMLGEEQFDGIILDAPCTGSGTWGRTPEMITSFDVHSITRFAGLQKQIAANVIQHLKPGRPLIYITCSVFAEENEQVVAHLQAQFGLKTAGMGVLHGYRHKADSMFVARLIGE